MRVTCDKCGKVLNVPDQHAGKKGRCPGCSSIIQLPMLGADGLQLEALSGLDQGGAIPRQGGAIPPPLPGQAAPMGIAASGGAQSLWGTGGGLATAPPPAMQLCPSCHNSMADNAVICIGCGYDKRSGTQHSVRVTNRPAPATQDECSGGGFFAPEKKALSYGAIGGLLLMLIAVVWFVLGWMGGFIFYYPPILFVIGLYGFLKGLFSGNITGDGE